MAVVPEALRPPSAARPRSRPGAEWARVRAATVVTTSHWVWVGAVGRDGYPQVWAAPAPERPSTSVRVSRWMWAAFNGPIPDGLVCRHRCDLTVCVAPADLLAGTQSENLTRPAQMTEPRRPVATPVGSVSRRWCQGCGRQAWSWAGSRG